MLFPFLIIKSLELQRVPINIVHGEIADYLKSGSDEQVQFYSILMFMIGKKIQENPLMQTRGTID